MPSPRSAGSCLRPSQRGHALRDLPASTEFPASSRGQRARGRGRTHELADEPPGPQLERITAGYEGGRMARTRGASRGRRAEVFDAAAQIFYEKGYEAASIQDIADQLGLLKGSLYYYISSKEDVLYEIIEELPRRNPELLRRHCGSDEPMMDRLRRSLPRRRPIPLTTWSSPASSSVSARTQPRASRSHDRGRVRPTRQVRPGLHSRRAGAGTLSQGHRAAHHIVRHPRNDDLGISLVPAEGPATAEEMGGSSLISRFRVCSTDRRGQAQPGTPNCYGSPTPVPVSRRSRFCRRLDDFAYGAGLWWGVVRAREPRALIPRRPK